MGEDPATDFSVSLADRLAYASRTYRYRKRAILVMLRHPLWAGGSPGQQ
jgi:hypothetical protein